MENQGFRPVIVMLSRCRTVDVYNYSNSIIDCTGMMSLLDAGQNHQTRGHPLKISPKPSTPCWKEWLATWTSQLSPTSQLVQGLQVMTT